MAMLLNAPAPDLVPVLALPFGALLTCAAVSLGIYLAWGRMRHSK